MKTKLKLRRDAVVAYFGKLEIDVYWPTVYWRKKMKGIYAKSVILFRPEYDWKWDWSVAIQILGFGIGVCWNHCDNPSHEARPHD